MQAAGRTSLHLAKRYDWCGFETHFAQFTARPSNAASDSYVNYYFEKLWPNGQCRAAHYCSSDFPKVTVENMVRLDVDFWAVEFSLPAVTVPRPAGGWPELERCCLAIAPPGILSQA